MLSILLIKTLILIFLLFLFFLTRTILTAQKYEFAQFMCDIAVGAKIANTTLSCFLWHGTILQKGPALEGIEKFFGSYAANFTRTRSIHSLWWVYVRKVTCMFLVRLWLLSIVFFYVYVAFFWR